MDNHRRIHVTIMAVLAFIGITTLVTVFRKVVYADQLPSHTFTNNITSDSIGIIQKYNQTSTSNSEASAYGDALTWTQYQPANSPPAREFHTMAYDNIRSRVVLFGGRNIGFLGDTWEWDGVNWIQHFPDSAPTGRVGHAMAYDSARARTVLFGGYDGIWPADTWEWDGTDWWDIEPLISPPGHTGHGLAYDSARDVTVYFGGFGADFTNQTWEWDGVNWVQRFPLHPPAVRAHHGMAYDEHRQKIVLFGGYNYTGVLNDTWEWDGEDWTQRFPVNSPSPRSNLGMAYDLTRKRIVLFGGNSDTGDLNDTWEWDGINWRHILPLASLPARHDHAIAYDTDHTQTVLFGGSGASGFLDDTWKYWGFSAQITPSDRLVIPGDIITYALVVEGSSISITLLLEELPAGVSGAFYPSPNITPPAQTTLMITTTSATPDGIYSIVVDITADELSTSIPLTLTVITPDFELIPIPASWSIYPGTSITHNVFISASITFSSPVELSLIGVVDPKNWTPG